MDEQVLVTLHAPCRRPSSGPGGRGLAWLVCALLGGCHWVLPIPTVSGEDNDGARSDGSRLDARAGDGAPPDGPLLDTLSDRGPSAEAKPSDGSTVPVTHVWSKNVGGGATDFVYALALDSSGNLYIAGQSFSPASYGGSSLSCSTATLDAIVASYTPAGVHRWSRCIGGSGTDRAQDVAVDSSGNVYLTGQVASSVDFGGGATSGGNGDVFVASYSALGVYRWAKRFGTLIDNEGLGLDVDPNGTSYVTGRYYNKINFGGSDLLAASAGATDLFLASFDASGAHRWSWRHGGTEGEIGNDVARDGSGNVYVTGKFSGSASFGGSTLVSAGSDDVFLASYTTAAGAHRWSQSFGASGLDVGSRLAVDAGGSVYLVGAFAGQASFGGSALSSAGQSDAFIASYTSLGAHRWSRRMGSTDPDTGLGVAVSPAGNVYVTGRFAGSADFGGGNLTAQGTADAFVASYAPTSGVHRWSRRFGGASYDTGYAVGAATGNQVYAAGQFGATVDFGGGALSASGSYDVYLLKLSAP